MYNMEGNKISGLIISINFKKAFDTISWQCISQKLEFFKFGFSYLR